MSPLHGLWISVLVLGSCPALGQYAVGIRAGALTMEMLRSGSSKAIQPIATTSTGLFLQVPLGGLAGYRLAVDHMVRRCTLKQYTIASRMEELSMRTTFIQLTTEVRFRIGERSPFHFEFGPQLGFQLTERSRGISYYTYPFNGSNLLVIDESLSPMRFSDVRLRVGFGADLRLGQRLLAVLSGGAGLGAGDWFRQTPHINLEVHGHVGLAYAPGPRPRKRRR